VRRRWIRTTSTTTNRTPATIRIIRVLSISTFLSVELQFGHIPQPELYPDEARRKSGEATRPGRRRRLSAELAQIHGAAGTLKRSALLDACAAALDQNDQNDHKKNTGNNPDDQSAVHFDFPFSKKFVSWVPQSA
jgi:hypothetical protein